MSGFRRCQGCGRRLTDVLFCTQCGGWFCCPGCLAEDNVRHLRAKADLGQSSEAVRCYVAIRAGTQSWQDGCQGSGNMVACPSHGSIVSTTHVSQKLFQVVETYRLGEVGVEARCL